MSAPISADDTVIDVALGAQRYDVIVGAGLIGRAGSIIAPLLKRNFVAVVTDENVRDAHGPALDAALADAGVKATTIALPPGEATKSFNQLESLLSALLDAGVERGDLVIAFGGGVVGDITGFAAAILRRGCRFVQAPTTLLAQVDSSVGGKTAVNASQGKNLIGAFHQPSLVLADIDALSTLSARQLRAGYAEVVKYGALGDSTFFSWLEANGARALAGDKAALKYAVATSVAAKARIVAEDERETGVRALLNLGHTFGHALEAAFGYSDALLHGEAVAAGMGLAFDYSVRAGRCADADARRVKQHLRACGLPAGLADVAGATDFSASALAALMMQDKKVKAGRLTLILAHGLGRAFIADDAALDDVRAFLVEAGAKQ